MIVPPQQKSSKLSILISVGVFAVILIALTPTIIQSIQSTPPDATLCNGYCEPNYNILWIIVTIGLIGGIFVAMPKYAFNRGQS